MKIALIGIIAGMISGLFSSGGGLILVPVFTYLLKLEEKEARATSLFCMVFMVIVTATVYQQNNFIHWSLGIKCAIGGIVGGVIGGKLLNKLPDKYLQIAFIVFLLYAGINNLLR